MSDRQTVGTYLAGKETLHRRELVWGWVREPAAPRWEHQEIDPVARAVTVLTFPEAGRVRRRTFRGKAPIESMVLAGLRATVAAVFDDNA